MTNRSAFIVLLAIAAVCVPLRAADEDDPRVVELKKQVEELQAKVTALEQQLRAAGVGELTAEEKGKVDAFLALLSPAERRQMEQQLASMPEPQRQQTMRQILTSFPQLVRARKRSQATHVLEDLRMLDAATDQYAIETSRAGGFHPTFADLKNYLKEGTALYNTGADVFGNKYGPFTIDSIPKVPAGAFNALSDVADPSFWSPFR